MSVYTNTVPGGHVRAPGEPQILFAIESQLDMIAHAIGIDPIAVPDCECRASRAWLTCSRRCGVRAIGRAGYPRPVAVRGMSGFMRHVGGGKTSVKLIAHAGGTIEVQTGLADQGGGNITAVQRVA